MRALVWRGVALLVGLAVIALASASLWRQALDYYGGHWVYAPEDAAWVLGPVARKLIDQTFADANQRIVVDHGVQILTWGTLSASNVDHKSRPTGNRPGPLIWLQRELRWRAGGIAADSPRPDAQYLARLVRQTQAMPGPYQAWIQARWAAGRSKTSHLPFVSNSYIVGLASRGEATTLAPVVSMSAGQPDRLAHWLEAGATRIIWNPAVQKLDPVARTTKAIYSELAAHDATLQVMIGRQSAGDGRRPWVPPSIVRAALDAGVHVELIIGGPIGPDGQRVMPALFDLLAYAGHANRLTVSLAGVLASNRIDSVLWPLLQHPQFYDQLVYASDYPDSARPGAVALGRLVAEGFIAPALEAPLRAIYDVNPLLFVLATMRAVHLPQTTLTLPATVFFATPDSPSGK
ncbi:MAG: hypothetical protein PF501_02955 [Salinisphaera sp.]|jgi:hypothetical protein|nr:hypothetical protein [Salinisphaera sp.]